VCLDFLKKIIKISRFSTFYPSFRSQLLTSMYRETFCGIVERFFLKKKKSNRKKLDTFFGGIIQTAEPL
jgi:hypothetical protein